MAKFPRVIPQGPDAGNLPASAPGSPSARGAPLFSDLFGGAGYLACLKMEMDGPFRVRQDNEPDQGDYQIARLTLHWGRL